LGLQVRGCGFWAWILVLMVLFYPAGEKKGSSPTLQFENSGPREADSWLFPVRGLAQRRLAFDSTTCYGTKKNTAGAGNPFFCDAVSAHCPVFLEPDGRLPPSPRSPDAPCTRAEKNKRPFPVERELAPTVFWRREIPEELRRRKAASAGSRARVASVPKEVPCPVAAGYCSPSDIFVNRPLALYRLMEKTHTGGKRPLWAFSLLERPIRARSMGFYPQPI
jgi:hypothetical protein